MKAHRFTIDTILKTVYRIGIILSLSFGPACPPMRPVGVGNPQSVKLMVFGGQNHETYLRCLNCSQYASDSIFNQYGQHGSSYSQASILNPYGQFGSRYSQYGVCNSYAFDPPVIVDGNGTFYGRLTLNRYHAQLGMGRQYLAWLEAICSR